MPVVKGFAFLAVAGSRMPEIGEEDPLVKKNSNSYYWMQFPSW